MKRLISVLLVTLLLLTSVPIVGFAVDDSKTIESIEVHSLPYKTTLVLGVDSYTDTYYEHVNGTDIECEYEYFNIPDSGLEMKVNFTDGTSEIANDIWDYMDSSFSVTGQDYGEVWGIGTHTVTVSFYDCETTFEVEVIENPVESIEVVKLPDNTTLVMGKDSYISTYYDYSYDEYGNEFITEYEYEDFNISSDGMQIKVNFKDGTYDVTDNMWDYMGSYFQVSGQSYGEIWNVGTHVATVSFYNCETTFQVEVVENPVKSIEVYKLPDKTTLVPGVDSTTSSYYDYSYDEYGNEIVTEYEYEDFSVATDGMQIKVNFTDGTSEITEDLWDYMDSYFEVSGQEYGEIWDIGTHLVTIKFYNRETTFDVEVVENPVSGIEFISLPLKDEYLECEWVDLTGAKLQVNFKDGTNKVLTIVADDYGDSYGNWMVESGEIDGARWHFGVADRKENVAEYEFTYRGYSINFTTNVSNKSITKVSVLTEPDHYNGVGAKIKIDYNDRTFDETIILNADYRRGDGDYGIHSEYGYIQTEMGIFAGGFECSNLFETDKTTYRLTLGNSDCNDENSTQYADFYKVFSMLRTDALEWTLGGGYNWVFSLEGQWFSGELTEENIDAMIYTARDLVGYLYDIDYSSREISGDVAKEILKRIFSVDTVDLTLSEFYNADEDIYEFAISEYGWGDGPEKEKYTTQIYTNGIYVIKSVEILEGAEVNTVFEYHAFFGADGRCSYFNSTPKTFASLEIETLPSKTEYFVGDEVDLSGLKLKYTDEDSQEATIEAGYETDVTVVDSIEIDAITVSYNGLMVEIPITVKPLELVKISVDTLPDKLYYKCGDIFDSTGLKLLLTYNNGKTEKIDSGFVCVPELLSVAGNQVIAVIYGEVTTTFTVNVSANDTVTDGKVHSVSVSDISLDYKSSTTINPQTSADADVKYTVTYSSSNPSVASVDANGKVSTGKTGSATITVTVTDEYGNTVSDTCNVEVKYNWWQWIIVIVLFGWIWY